MSRTGPDIQLPSAPLREGPGTMSPQLLLRLQRAAGNSAVAELFRSVSYHAARGRKATVGPDISAESSAIHPLSEDLQVKGKLEKADSHPKQLFFEVAHRRSAAVQRQTAVDEEFTSSEGGVSGPGAGFEEAADQAEADAFGGDSAPGPGGLGTAGEQQQDTLTSAKLAASPRLQRAFHNNPAIHIGESGDAVRLVQEALRDGGFELPGSTKPTGELDGQFGGETFTVLKQFQASRTIDVDGIVGRQTLRELDKVEAAAGEAPLLKPRPGDQPSVIELPGGLQILVRDLGEIPDILVPGRGPAGIPPVLGSPGNKPKKPAKKPPPPEPTSDAFQLAKQADAAVGLALKKGPLEQQQFLEAATSELEAARPMERLITTVQSLRLNFRSSFHTLVDRLDRDQFPRVALASDVIQSPDSLTGRKADELASTASVSSDDATAVVAFIATVSGRAQGRPAWSDPTNGLPRAAKGVTSTLSPQQQEMLSFIRDFRSSIKVNEGLNKVPGGLQYVGQGKTDPKPGEVEQAGAGSLEDDLWDELKLEGGSSAINTFDTAILTWGRGFAARGGQMNQLVNKLYKKAPGLVDELYQAGFALPKGGTAKDWLAVDIGTGEVREGDSALEMLRNDAVFDSVLIAVAEADDYKQAMAEGEWELLRQNETFRPVRDTALRSQIATWPRDSIRWIAHSIHGAGSLSWKDYVPATGGDLAQIASVCFRKLGGNFVLQQQSGARLSKGLFTHAPITWGHAALLPLTAGPQPLPTDVQTDPAQAGKVFLPAEGKREPLDKKGNLNAGMQVRIFQLTS